MVSHSEQCNLTAYQATILLAGAVLLLLNLPRLLSLPLESLLEVCALSLLVVLASARPILIPLPNLKIINKQDTCVTASDAIILFLVVGYGEAAAIYAAVIDGFIGSRVMTPPSNANRTKINLRSAALMAISVAFAAQIAQLCLSQFGGSSEPGFGHSLTVVLMALSAAAVTHFLFNTFVIASFQALRHHRSVIQEWIGNYLWMGLSHLPSIFAAGIMYFGIHSFGRAAWLVGLPVSAFAYLSFKLYYDKMREKVQHAQQINAIHMRTIEALAKAVDAKDQVAHDHIKRVQTYALGMARFLQLSESETEALRAGALLYDIGKLAVPDYILNKPGKLTAAEFERMKIHTVVGAEIVSTIGFPYPVAPIVRHHHERWDGRGYPDGLKGEEIPITARILALADCYDVMSQDRPYSKRLTREETIAFLRENRGTQFDPRLVDLFIAHLDEFEHEIAALLPKAREAAAERNAIAPNAVPNNGLATDKPTGTYLERISSATREFNTLYQMAQSVAASLELDTTLGIIAEQLRSLIFFDTCVIYLTVPEGGAAVARYADGYGSRALARRRVAFNEGLTGWVLAHQEHFYNTDPALDLGGINCEECEAFRNLYVFPLIKDHETLGAVALYSRSCEQYTQDHVRLIEMATPIASEAVNNALCYARREEDALTDELTGLANSRAIYLTANKEIQRCQRDGRTLTVLMMDLDLFKQVNDTHGHRVGSRMLSELGPVIAQALRPQDFIARYGGDEFFALLPELNRDQAQPYIHRIEAAVNAYRMVVEGGQTISVGISIGAAELGRDGDSLEELLIKADLAMYTVKAEHKLERQRREQVVTHIDCEARTVSQ